MVTSSYMPDVKVEIAFDSGWSTAAADRTWTDVSTYVELEQGINITVGRSDERSTADANQLTLTLDNSDGRFTAGLSSGAYYPNVKIGRPIRVTADPVDGSSSVRFLGFINEWPTEWNDTDAYASATITASSRLAWIGEQAGLKSVIEETILPDSPIAYYTLSEPEGSLQANDSSGYAVSGVRQIVSPLIVDGDPELPLEFGSATGPGTDSLTAAKFVGGQYLAGHMTLVGTAHTFEGTFLYDAVAVTPLPPLAITGSSTKAIIQVDTTGHLEATDGVDSITSTDVFTAGETHTFALVVSGTSWELYGDGDSVGTGTLTSLGAGDYVVEVGHGFTGTLSHVAFFDSALSSTAVTAHAESELTGFAGDTTSERLERYATLAGIDSDEVSTETGQTTMESVDTTDKAAAELMRVCETTEGGVLFDAPDGTLTFHNRAHRYQASSSYTLTMSDQEIEAGYAPKVDKTAVANDVTAQNQSGSVTARAFDADSIDDIGRATGQVTTASEDKHQPDDLAGWLLYRYKEPRERAPELAVVATAQVGKTPDCATVMATTVGDRVTVAGRPSQAASSSVDYYVEGWTEAYSQERVLMTFNVSPAFPYDDVLVIDDATLGEIDAYVVAL